MRLHVEQAGRIRQVTVAAGEAPDTVDVHLGDQVVTCEVREHQPGHLSLRLPDGSMHDIVVETEAAPGHRSVLVEGRRLPITVSSDEVEARQPVIVIEAMKMENALTAGRAGTVKEVLVQEGVSVEAGRPLVVVE